MRKPAVSSTTRSRISAEHGLVIDDADPTKRKLYKGDLSRT